MSMENKKYPRTPHLDFSPGKGANDLLLRDESAFLGKTIVITEKMDGECSGMTRNKYHARSLDSLDHPSRHWVKAFHNKIKQNIPKGWKVFGENLYAKHTIQYEKLNSYFLVFSVWKNNGYCLSWEDTTNWCNLNSFLTVPEIYTGSYNKKVLLEYSNIHEQDDKSEGFVVRNTESFHYDDFDKNVAKWVKKDFVQTTKHWKFGKIIKNKMIK